MPVYTYRCESCGVQFDRRQNFSDKPLVRCPECNRNSLRKLYLPVGIVFKGSGFYATDHRSPSGQTSTPSAEVKEATKTKDEKSPSTSAKEADE